MIMTRVPAPPLLVLKVGGIWAVAAATTADRAVLLDVAEEPALRAWEQTRSQ